MDSLDWYSQDRATIQSSYRATLTIPYRSLGAKTSSSAEGMLWVEGHAVGPTPEKNRSKWKNWAIH